MGVNQTWNVNYENSPAAGDNPGGGDNAFRNLKTSVSTRFAKEHLFPTSDNLGRQGIHQPGSAFPFFSNSAPQIRTDGTPFEADIDEGRLWIDLDTGRIYYLKSIDETGTPTWSVLKLETIGKIAAFAAPPDVSERWLPCDGREIDSNENSLDGEEGGYSDLVTLLDNYVSGAIDHPYYSENANSVHIPDYRGVSLRGLDDMSSADGTATRTSANRDEGTRENWNGDDITSFDYAGSYQEDALEDHRHEMDHTHGSTITDGYDVGDGRTGVPDWNAGDPQMDSASEGVEDGNWKGDGHLTNDGVLTMRDPSARQDAGGFSVGAEEDNVTVDLEHYHTIPRHYGLTRKLADAAEDIDHDVPEPDDVNYADETLTKNVAVYWFIKY